MANKLSNLLLSILLLLVIFNCQAQIPEQKVFEQYAKTSLEEFKELLSLPNDAHNPEDIEKNVAWCESHFKARGFKLKRLYTPGAPLLLAEKKAESANAPTVLVYLQLDGQPVDPSYWMQDDPYQPVLMKEDGQGKWEEINWQLLYREIDSDWRIFARSVSDAKGPVLMFLTALDILTNERRKPNFHIKVIMDFEEEMGSPHLPDAVARFTDALDADMLVIFDGPRHITNEPTLTFGARGISTITLEVFGPVKPQHSGHYGNYAPNPAIRLSRLLASMKDDQGRVIIPGFYQGIELSAEVKKTLQKVPDDEDEIKSKIGIAEADKVAATYQESLQYPSLNVRGLSSGWVRESARTIVPATAIAEIDIRLVLESDPDRLISLVRDHINQQGYYVIDRPPTAEERSRYSKICQFNSTTSYLAYRTDLDSKVGVWLSSAVSKAFGKEPIKIRTSGGSIPISPFVKALAIPAVAVPTVNRDNNQHSPNENLRVGNYIDGIKTIYAILTEPL